MREATGGLCPSGPCDERLEVLRDGTWASSDEAGPVGSGFLDDDRLAELGAAVSAAGGVSDASVTCGDSVADGPDITYTWYADDGTTVLYTLIASPTGRTSA